MDGLTKNLLIGASIFILAGVSLVYLFLGGSSDSPVNTSVNLANLNDVSQKQPVIQEGKRLYQRYCVTCHGIEGKGNGSAAPVMDPSPSSFHSQRAKEWSSSEIFEMISNGVPENGMPAWKDQLTKGQRWALVSYIQKRWTEF